MLGIKLRLKSYMPQYIITPIYKLIPIILLLSFFEIIGLALLIPIIKLILDPKLIHNTYINIIWVWAGNPEIIPFILLIFSAVILVFILKTILSYFLIKKQSVLTYEIISKIIFSKYTKFLNKPFINHINNDPSKELAAIINIPYYYSSGIIMPIIILISEIILLSIVFAIILFFNFYIFISLLVFLAPIVFLYVRFYKNRLKSISETNEKYQMHLNKIVHESIECIREIIVFNKINMYEKCVNDDITALKNNNIKYHIITLNSPRIIEILTVFALGFTLVTSYFFNMNIANVANFLILLVVSMYKAIPSINKIILAINNIRANTFTINYIKNEEKLLIKNQSHEMLNEIEFNKLHLKNLSFKYNDNYILKDINLLINKGDSIGIQGPSGSGKTTLINILLRLITENDGSIELNEKNIKEIKNAEWYKIIGFVPQNIVLFDGTILENITWNKTNNDKNLKHVDSIIRMLNLDDFIKSLPNGLQTQIGDKGIKISGGQRQRIAIARALFNKPQLLIFDEATSALDKESENIITESIKNLNLTGITTIIIAHRTETLKYCNKKYSLENTKIYPVLNA